MSSYGNTRHVAAVGTTDTGISWNQVYYIREVRIAAGCSAR